MVDTPTSAPDGPLQPKGIPAQDINIIELQLDRFYRARDAMMAWSLIATECVDFFEGRQITEEERNLMIEEGRPAIILNKIRPLVRLVKGYFRQNRTQIMCKPGSDGMGDQATADALNMVHKQVDEQNQSEWNAAEVFTDGLLCGRGYFDTRLDFENNVFGQIKETVQDPFSTYIDPEATMYDPSGWGFTQTGTWMSITDIEHYYGKEARALVDFGGGTFSNFPVRGDGGLSGTENDHTPVRSFGLSEDKVRSFDSQYFGAVQSYNIFDHINKERRLVRVIECQHKVWMQGPFLLDMQTGDKRPIPLHWTRERLAHLEDFARQNNLPITLATGSYKRLRWTVTAADRILYDNWSLYRDYTLSPYFPYFRRGVTQGMVSDLLDPQREINKRRSNMLHILTTMAHSGWMWEKGALDAEEAEVIETEGARPGINLQYNKGYKAPERIMPGIPSRGHELAGTEATEDLKQIANINDSALGQLDVVQSGRAVEARQRQAIIGLEDYFDNWDRTMQLKGKVRNNIIQDYYTEPRIIRIVGADGQDQTTAINVANAAGEITNNVTVGTYNIVIDKQPLSATFKDAQFSEAMEMRKQGVPIPDDILVDLSSMPKKEEIKGRLQAVQQQQAQAAGVKLPTPGPAGAAGGAPPSSATQQPAPRVAPPGQGPLQQSAQAPQQAQRPAQALPSPQGD